MPRVEQEDGSLDPRTEILVDTPPHTHHEQDQALEAKGSVGKGTYQQAQESTEKIKRTQLGMAV